MSVARVVHKQFSSFATLFIYICQQITCSSFFFLLKYIFSLCGLHFYQRATTILKTIKSGTYDFSCGRF